MYILSYVTMKSITTNKKLSRCWDSATCEPLNALFSICVESLTAKNTASIQPSLLSKVRILRCRCRIYDTDTDTDILARILADTSDTRD